MTSNLSHRLQRLQRECEVSIAPMFLLCATCAAVAAWWV